MLGVRSVDLFHVLVPLRKPIRHASFVRPDSDNVVVRVTLTNGLTGYGEGVPRSYVTGETVESAFEALSRFDVNRNLGGPLTNFESAVQAVGRIVLPETADDPRGMAGNSARAALELALLDAYGKTFGRSVGDAVRMFVADSAWLHSRPSAVRYSGAITAESHRGETISAWKMRIYGFAQVKVKVGVAGQDDPARLSRFRQILGRRTDIRIDANEAWAASAVVEHVLPLLKSRPSVLEQPVRHAEVEALAAIRGQLASRGGQNQLKIMLDESLCGFPDATRAVDGGLADYLNVRISKCGGIGPSVRIMDLAWRSGLGVQLGCHPGETGLLSAAGRHLASQLKRIDYLEGSYDRHVLAANLIKEDLTFRYGGRAQPLDGPGLGVTIDPEALARMTVAHLEVDHG